MLSCNIIEVIKINIAIHLTYIVYLLLLCIKGKENQKNPKTMAQFKLTNEITKEVAQVFENRCAAQASKAKPS